MHLTRWIQNALARSRLLTMKSGALDLFAFCWCTPKITSSCFVQLNAWFCCLQTTVNSASFLTTGIYSKGCKRWPLLHSSAFRNRPLRFHEKLHFDFCFYQLGCHVVTPHKTSSKRLCWNSCIYFKSHFGSGNPSLVSAFRVALGSPNLYIAANYSKTWFIFCSDHLRRLSEICQKMPIS